MNNDHPPESHDGRWGLWNKLISLLLSFAFLPRPESTHVDRKLTETNRGHQLLRRMGETFDCLWVADKMWPTFLYLFSGWEGAGLGFQEQGIQEPIKGGEVRDKQDKYKVYPTVHWNTYIPYSRKIWQFDGRGWNCQCFRLYSSM